MEDYAKQSKKWGKNFQKSPRKDYQKALYSFKIFFTNLIRRITGKTSNQIPSQFTKKNKENWKYTEDYSSYFSKTSKTSTNQSLSFREKRFHWKWPQICVLLIFFFLIFLGGRYYWREMRWRYIILHHTASDIGNLEFYRKLHTKRWGDLAYHIVINNGSEGTAAGQIEFSERWTKREYHYSTKKSYLNYFGIAIALVGDFESHSVPTVQKQILIRFLVNLSREYDIPPERIIGHREVQNTKCPGKYINMVNIRSLVKKQLLHLQ